MTMPDDDGFEGTGDSPTREPWWKEFPDPANIYYNWLSERRQRGLRDDIASFEKLRVQHDVGRANQILATLMEQWNSGAETISNPLFDQGYYSGRYPDGQGGYSEEGVPGNGLSGFEESILILKSEGEKFGQIIKFVN